MYRPIFGAGTGLLGAVSVLDAVEHLQRRVIEVHMLFKKGFW